MQHRMLFLHDIKSCPRNQSFLADMEGWSAIAPNMYIWDYVVYYQHYLMPYPNMNVLQPNIKTFRDNNAMVLWNRAITKAVGVNFPN